MKTVYATEHTGAAANVCIALCSLDERHMLSGDILHVIGCLDAPTWIPIDGWFTSELDTDKIYPRFTVRENFNG